MFISTSPRRRFPSTPLLLAALLLPFAAARAATPAAAPADIALAVVYDTSGSMRGTIRNQDGRPEAKHLVARRAFELVIQRLERFTQPAPGAPAKRLDLALVTFDGNRPHLARPLAPLDPAATRQWLDSLRPPDSGTPLGDAMALAGRALLATPAASKHLLVLTDGANTTGATPLVALDHLQKQNQTHDTPVFVHVLALDISPSVFASLQKAGATLIGASDEKQLQSQLDFILETQILVEAP